MQIPYVYAFIYAFLLGSFCKEKKENVDCKDDLKLLKYDNEFYFLMGYLMFWQRKNSSQLQGIIKTRKQTVIIPYSRL